MTLRRSFSLSAPAYASSTGGNLAQQQRQTLGRTRSVIWHSEMRPHIDADDVRLHQKWTRPRQGQLFLGERARHI